MASLRSNLVVKGDFDGTLVAYEKLLTFDPQNEAALLGVAHINNIKN